MVSAPQATAPDATGPGGLETWCNRLAHATLPSDYQILEEGDLGQGHPWAFLSNIALLQPGAVAYYRYLYGIACLENPRHVLEVGTAFGLGGAAIIQGAPELERLISLDLGVFSTQYEIVDKAEGAGWPVMDRYRTEELPADGRNIAFAREALGRLTLKQGRHVRLALYQVNTQTGGTDNFDALVRVPHWRQVDELVRELEAAPIDLLFIDGKHTGDGLYQDFRSFFPYVRPGGLVICDDVHDSTFSYKWAGQTLASFERARREFAAEIEDSYIWPFPQLPDWHDQEPTARPWGLVRKKGPRNTSGRLSLNALSARDLAGLDVTFVAQRLRFLRDHGALLAELEARGFGDRSAAWLRFMREHEPVFTELEALGLADVAAGRLRFISQNDALFAELEALGLAEFAADRLQFVRREEELFVALESLGLASHAASWLRFIEQHPALVSYLAVRPGLAADAERYVAEVSRGGALPNVRLAAKLLPRWLLGKYRWESR